MQQSFHYYKYICFYLLCYLWILRFSLTLLVCIWVCVVSVSSTQLSVCVQRGGCWWVDSPACWSAMGMDSCYTDNKHTLPPVCLCMCASCIFMPVSVLCFVCLHACVFMPVPVLSPGKVKLGWDWRAPPSSPLCCWVSGWLSLPYHNPAWPQTHATPSLPSPGARTIQLKKREAKNYNLFIFSDSLALVQK